MEVQRVVLGLRKEAEEKTREQGLVTTNCKRRVHRVKPEEIPDFDGKAASFDRWVQLFQAYVGEDENIAEVVKVELLAVKVKQHASLIREAGSLEEALKNLYSRMKEPWQV